MFVILIYKFEFWSRMRIAGISKQTTDNLLVEHEKLFFFVCVFWYVRKVHNENRMQTKKETEGKRGKEREKKNVVRYEFG